MTVRNDGLFYEKNVGNMHPSVNKESRELERRHMKSFFEEYGFVMLAAVVVIALIGMTTNVGSAIESNITGLITSFSAKIGASLNGV